MSNPVFIVLISALLLTACSADPEDNRPGQPVSHRKAAFKEIVRSFEPMGVMLRTSTYDSKKFQELTATFMARRDAPWSYFSADTHYPPTRAKAEVWTKTEEFEADKKAFLEATDKLAAIAGTADKDLARSAYATVEKSCKNCHDAFRTR